MTPITIKIVERETEDGYDAIRLDTEGKEVGRWSFGETPRESVGNLVFARPDEFNIKFETKYYPSL